MSEAAEGVLFLKQHIDTVKERMKDFAAPFIVRVLDEKWATLFVESYYSPQIQAKLFEISNEVPLLYFADGEYGWAFAVYWEGKKPVTLGTEAEDIDENADFTYRDYSPERCAKCDFDALTVFDLDTDTLIKLRTGLTAEPVPDRIPMSGGAFFMGLVGIGEMWAMNYRQVAHLATEEDDDDNE